MKAIDRLWPNVEEMNKVSTLLAGQRNLNEWETLRLERHLGAALKKAAVFEATRTDLLGQCDTDEEREVMLDRLMRVPANEITRLRKLESGNRVAALRELLNKYKPGNGGHDKHHFDRTAVYSPFDAGEKFDHLGLKRRPRIVYEVIDRMLHAVLHPQDNKPIFFRRTKYKVQKWDDYMRQIRSEGRESMIKVLVTLLLNWNPRRMISGIEEAGKWLGLSIAEVARRSGLSKSRVKEALRNLERTDILWTGKQKRTYDKQTGQWRGYAVVRAFKPTLFAALEIDQKVWKARAYVPKPQTQKDLDIDAQATGMRSVADVLDMINSAVG